MTLDSQRLLGLQVGLATIFDIPYKAIDLEIQDGGDFLLATIELDSDDPPVAQLTAAATRLLDQSVLPRSDEYSWMMNFTHAGALFDSESGGWSRR